MRKFVKILAILALGLVLWVFLLKSLNPLPPPVPDPEQMLRARSIANGILLFALHNDNRSPENLAVLVPSYVGTNLNIEEFRLTTPSAPISSDMQLVVEREPGSDGLFLVIKGDGEIFFLRPGD